MNFDVLRVQDFNHLSHEFKTQMAILENNPVSLQESLFDLLSSNLLLLLSHGYLFSWEFLLLLGELINRVGWISSSREQEENWYVNLGLLPQFFNWVSNRGSESRSKSLLNELGSRQKSSVLSKRSNQAQVNEVSDVLISKDLLLIVRHRGILRFILIDPSSPSLFISSDSVRQLLEEESGFFSEFMF